MKESHLNPTEIIRSLERNSGVFRALLSGQEEKLYQWRPGPGKWNLLEIVCHLKDEEVEDFRQRTRICLEMPGTFPPPFDPEAWVMERSYARRDYAESVADFLREREQSVQWLRGLKAPNWDSGFENPHFGRMTAGLFLANWWAHDLLHLRQIHKLQFLYCRENGVHSLEYAGEW